MARQRRRIRGQSQIQAITAPWRGPLTALSGVILAGSIGYRITEGWDWGDCLWMVLITISTIGSARCIHFPHRADWSPC